MIEPTMMRKPIIAVQIRVVGTREILASRRVEGDWIDPWGGWFDHATLRMFDLAASQGLGLVEIPGRGPFEVYLSVTLDG